MKLNRKVLSSIAALILAWAIFFSVAEADVEDGVWRLDYMNTPELPRSFRIDETLKTSGSGQASIVGMKLLYENLREHTDNKIYIVDLRQEPHGFINDYPTSWYVEKNLANFFRGNDEIESDELERLESIIGNDVILFPLGNYDKAHFQPVKIAVTSINTERNIATEIGFEYVRFGVTDMFFPAPDVVDDFINFVNAVDKDDWLHFHCQAGHGRTTTFIVMYDIIVNPDKSLAEICERQAILGGTNLIERRGGDPYDYYVQAHNLRADSIERFYDYVHNWMDKMTWSEYWTKEIS